MRFMRLLVLAAALTACASGYNSESITGGFSERQISENVWQIVYSGNGYTTDETVQTYWLYRSAQVASEHGYEGFRIANDIELTRARPGEAQLRPAVYREGDAVLAPVVERGLAGKPYMVGNIVLLHAPLANEPGRVFDARALEAFLAPYVTGQLCGGNVCPHVHRYLFPGFSDQPATTS